MKNPPTSPLKERNKMPNLYTNLKSNHFAESKSEHEIIHRWLNLSYIQEADGCTMKLKIWVLISPLPIDKAISQ